MAAGTSTNASEQKDVREKQVALVVDGDVRQRFQTSVYLQRLGYHVFSVATGEEALQAVELAVPFVVVQEAALPGMSGIELLQKLKRHPRTLRVPVVVYTKDPSARAACEQAGCAVYLTPTPDHNRLYAAVQKVTESTPRSFVRLSIFLEALVGGGGQGAQKRGRITAISERGMFVSTTEIHPFGRVLPFTFILPTAPDRSIELEGRVLYSHAGGDGKLAGMGITFVKIAPADEDRIREFIGSLLVAGIVKEGHKGK